MERARENYRETLRSYRDFFKSVGYTKGYEIASKYLERVTEVEPEKLEKASETFAMATVALWLGNTKAADKLVKELEKDLKD